jgi:hypothetical protein
MTILDKLVEKKEVYKYVDARIEHLKMLLMTENITKYPENQRETEKRKILARMNELTKLKDCIHRNRLKPVSERYWEDTRGITHD